MSINEFGTGSRSARIGEDRVKSRMVSVKEEDSSNESYNSVCIEPTNALPQLVGKAVHFGRQPPVRDSLTRDDQASLLLDIEVGGKPQQHKCSDTIKSVGLTQPAAGQFKHGGNKITRKQYKKQNKKEMLSLKKPWSTEFVKTRDQKPSGDQSARSRRDEAFISHDEGGVNASRIKGEAQAILTELDEAKYGPEPEVEVMGVDEELVNPRPTLPECPPGYVWALNKHALQGCFRKLHYLGFETDALVYDKFKISGYVQNFIVVQRFPYWCGQGSALKSSECCVLVMVKRDDLAYISDYVGTYVAGGPYERLHNSALAVARTAGRLKIDSMQDIEHRIKVHYRRYNHDYPNLEADVLRLSQSKWFSDQLSQASKVELSNWEKKNFDYLESVYARLGYGLVDVKRDLKNRLMRRYIHKALNVFLGSLVAIAIMRFVPLKAKALVAFPCAYVYQELDTVRYIRRECMNSLVNEIGIKKNTPSIAVCSLASIKSSIIAKERFSDIPIKSHSRIHAEYDEKDETLCKEVPIYGCSIKSIPMVYPDVGPQNTEAAVRIRLAEEKEMDNEFCRSFVNFAKSELLKQDVIEVPSITREDNLKFMIGQYGFKRAKELDKLWGQPIEDKDMTYGLFVKKEAYVGKTPENFKPRMIFCCPEVVVCNFGYALNLVAKGVMGPMGPANDVFCTSKSTPDDVGSYVQVASESFNSCYESDVSNWDGSINTHFLAIEKWFFSERVVGMSEQFSVLLRNWDVVSGARKDKSVTVKQRDGRRSGDLWTWFNSKLNDLVHRFVYELQDGHFKLMVLGDDSVLFVDNQYDVEDVSARYRSLGMKVVIEQRYSAFDVSYCSGIFLPVDGRLRWSNSPFRLLTKLGINHNNHAPRKYKRLLYGIAKGLLPTCGHVPVIGSMMRAICKSSEERNLTPFTDGRQDNPYRIQGGNVCFAGVDTFEVFADRYDINVEALIELDNWALATFDLDKFPCILDDEIFIKMAMRELGVDRNDNTNIRTDAQLAHDQSYEYIVNEAPVIEEASKLADTFAESMANAYAMGAEEDELLGTNSHKFLHMAFTTMSYVSFPWGVAVHRNYNKYAIERGWCPAAKPRPKPRYKAPPLPRDPRLPPLEEKVCEVCGTVFPAETLPAAQKQKRGKKKAKPTKQGGGTKQMVKEAIKAGIKAGFIGAGTAAGGYFGQPGIGGAVGGWLSKVIGSGDYTVKSNSLVSKGLPTFAGSKQTFRIKHREFICNVYGSVGFNLEVFEVNPGSPNVFPWLSAIAGQFAEYDMKGCVFEFLSTSGDSLNSTNTALGVVIMGSQYNVGRDTFTSKVEMESAMFSCASRPSENLLHPVECDSALRPIKNMFIRSGNLQDNDDPRFYDIVDFQIATEGMQAASVIGELWVTYDIVLMYPRCHPGQYSGSLSLIVNNGPYTNTNPLGVVQVTPLGSLEASITAVGAGYDSIWFHPEVDCGVFLITVFWTGTVGVIPLVGTPTLTNLSYITSVGDYGGFNLGSLGWIATNASAGGCTKNALFAIVRVDGHSQVGSTFTLTGMTLPTTQVAVDIHISPMQESYNL